MNRLISVCIAILLLFGGSFGLFSNPVDIEIAKRVAQNFMNQSRQTSKTVSDVVTERFEGQNSFYVVNFREGGWVMVSSEDKTIPVLAYSHNGTYRIEDEKPDGFLFWVAEYKGQVDFARKMESVRNNEIIDEWKKLLDGEEEKVDVSNTNVISQRGIVYPYYYPGDTLLNITGRGEVAWGQQKNNDGTCNPPYNMHCPIGPFGAICICACGVTINGTTYALPKAGCAPVAMGQVMWYWQWPNSSPRRVYNWELMPAKLSNGDMVGGNAIGHLLHDCGMAVGIGYSCCGSFAFSHLVESALIDTFNFKAATLENPGDWGGGGGAWISLIRTEIDCGRPVIFKGEECLLCSQKHYFVIDGHNGLFSPHFHINFGWTGSWNGYFYLSDITKPSGQGNFDFSKRHEAIIGISPTYTNTVNITNVSYSTVNSSKVEMAKQNITLPATGKNLTVENGGDLTLIAGNSIVLNHGFHAKAGSNFTIKIEPIYRNNMEITVSNWPSTTYDNIGFVLPVNNANSFDFIVKNSSGNIVYQNADITYSDVALLWIFGPSPGVYNCTIRLRNNYGRRLDHTWTVTVKNSQTKSAIFNDSTIIDNGDFSGIVSETSINNVIEKDQEEIKNDFSFFIFPNPTRGFVTLDYTLHIDAPICIELYNLFGQRLKLLVPQQNQKAGDYSVQTSVTDLPAGAYLIKVTSGDQSESRQLIINP